MILKILILSISDQGNLLTVLMVFVFFPFLFLLDEYFSL